MRKPPGKQLGYVILPIAITASQDPTNALDKNTDYDAVWEVLQALRAHDERFNAYINRIALGSTKPGSGPDDPIKVIPVDIDTPKTSDELQGRLFEYEESGLTPGSVIEYRLAVQTSEGPLYLPVQTARIPAPPPFALRFARYVASGDALQLHFTLPADAPVSVEVMDVAGRRVRRVGLATAEAGEHDVRVPGLGLASGWYFVRLHQGRDVRGSRLVVVR